MAILPPTSPTTFSGGFSFGRRAEMLQRHKHGYQIKSCIKLNSLSVLMKYNNGSHKYSHWNKGLLSLYQWAIKCVARVIYIPSLYIHTLCIYNYSISLITVIACTKKYSFFLLLIKLSSVAYTQSLLVIKIINHSLKLILLAFGPNSLSFCAEGHSYKIDIWN